MDRGELILFEKFGRKTEPEGKKSLKTGPKGWPETRPFPYTKPGKGRAPTAKTPEKAGPPAVYGMTEVMP